ncbi:hypothetical protein FNH22_01410 [Fulvivirga sp. M361]|uniref:PD40 domain-containing protein n=1 Tax=Fulvivirga sp. M361 TaxID=2594266 RepID=UPI00117A03CC|nr:PD40 domain-containing protein [Fulvivirga sp. M361]TRX62781.1 hypothetical protein FNH22_01410 [Fulvivirga sp. M361]
MMNRLSPFLIVFLGFIYFCSPGQTKVKLLPSNINKPSINYYAPFVSGDGRSMLYLHDYTDDGSHAMMYATKKTVSSWNDGVEVHKVVNKTNLNYRGGYSLSFDGDVMYFSSRKSGLGGFDIWSSTYTGATWLAPKNLGAPINSRENEGDPVLSPDGEYLYYMRCADMSEYRGANGCRIVVSKKKNARWSEPIDLPDNINTGNSQTPRLLSDGRTMIFASDKFGGKGGLDLFITRKEGEIWTDPVPLEFVNTDKNDHFVSVDAKGRYLYMAENTGRSSQLILKLIPKEFQPTRVMRIQGEVTDAVSGAPVDATLTVFNIDDRDRLWNGPVGNTGEFTIVLNEGASYDLSVSSADPTYMFYSKVYDLEKLGSRDKEKLKIELKPVELDTYFKTEISFEDYEPVLTDNSTFELRRVAAMMRKNPAMTIEVAAYLDLYKADSIKSDPDLTEIRIDSIYVERQISMTIDSMKTTYMNEEDSTHIINEDTTEIHSDSIQYQAIKELEIKYVYHNDRTEKESMAVKEYLMERGIEEDRISVRTYVNDDSLWMPVSEEEDQSEGKVEIRRIEMKFSSI